MLSLLGTAIGTILLTLSLIGVVAGGIRSGEAMSRYSSGSRQIAEDFDRADLDRIQQDARTAPIEVAQGLAEAAMSAQTIASPDVPKNAVGLGFTDGMSIGQLVVQYSDDALSESDPDADEPDDAYVPGPAGSSSAAVPDASGGAPVEQAKESFFLAWYAANIGFQPVWVTTVDTFREPGPASNWPGGGLDSTVKLETVALTGAFESREDAVEALEGMLSNKRYASGIYAGMTLADIGGNTHNMEHVWGGWD